jgi:periplasmic protein TonB
MPADLFRPNVVATSSRRRASLLPVSIALHVVAIAAFFIVPLLADVELPPPNQRVATPYIQVLPIAPPIAVRSKPATTKPVPSTAPMAPLVVPDSIPLEHEIATMGDLLPGADVGFTEGVDPGTLIPGEALPPAAAPPKASPKLVRPGGRIQPPRKIKNVSPVYPSIAQSSRVQGTVILEALIGLDGRVDHVRVLKPVALLTDPAIAAVRQWVFTPTRLNGEPVQVIMTVTVDFRLQ